MLPTLKNFVSFPNLVDEFFGKDNMPDFMARTGINIPAVNVSENTDYYKIEVAAPGLEKGDFVIDVTNNILTISSEKESKDEEKESKLLRREFNFCSFKRSFSLPVSVEQENITASHKDGILSILIPKREEAKQKPSRQIEIK
ncbi:MAG: hypothetical protein A2X12_01115 [Bacteroidetes bacterium GWE2_29_8]|nr:MAG: hypothetical protein A2X12_01115 [Bacteroidetes bacterium GWE2_29_8]OFY14412.1 MAG: hypothetical protein A2X02_01250 [Bacteroidetes bacterium GWF2_29_10]